ncbi:MAG: hypothetical protein ACOYN0_03255 [Phycisphaerales bacterium]
MRQSILKWSLYLFALLVAGPALASLAGNLRDAGGGHAATLLLTSNVGAGLLAGVAALGGALVIGVVGARLVAVGTGCTLAGIVLAWCGWRLGSLEDLARLPDKQVPLMLLAVENGLVAAVGAAIAFACVKFGRGLWSADNGTAMSSLPDPTEPPTRAALGTAFGAGVVGCALLTFFVANNGLKGQTLAAATIGGLAAAIMGQLVLAGKRSLITPVIPAASVVIVAVLGPIAAAILHGSKLDAAIYAGDVLPLARPISLEWAAGALMGVPLGLSWTATSVDPAAVERFGPGNSGNAAGQFAANVVGDSLTNR